ncbi:MAG: tRNA (adenosine(37)-N6)-threonylcarbamoyltransferase complex dimerization subunit type 1 TsaB [Tannerella sp.]|jgi:tRNA threonylcarbamoyladenosine biosynthesis protein TsaB|nr:tRNA (adenosine(37)-N6)-threonylcarbamoyltransferase complex dimerization subunit type 1 TsaB [Tannerella sp.]
MAIINIETSTAVCSVAVTVNDEIAFERVSKDEQSHAALLGVYVEEAMKIDEKIDAVAVSSGPGSYTGLRIGVSMAKGLCFGLNVPLLSIPTLYILAHKVVEDLPEADLPEDALFCPMLDARRMEVYAAIYDKSIQKVRDTEAEIITEESYSKYLSERKVYFFGNGSAKCKTVITSPNAVFIDEIRPLASDMRRLSQQAFDEKRFEDVAYFEPFYLKDFIATVAKNKVLPKKTKETIKE